MQLLTIASKQNRGAGCACSGCCGAFLLLLAVALVVLKVYLMSLAGPEPAGPITQAAITTEVVVDTVVPFSSADFNKRGPVRTAYIEGMQSVFDKQAGKGAVKVLDVHAHALSSVMLLQAHHNATLEGKGHRMSLAYTLKQTDGRKGGSKKVLLPNASASAATLEAGVHEAAKRQKGANVPKLLKEIAKGSRPAVANSKLALTFNKLPMQSAASAEC